MYSCPMSEMRDAHAWLEGKWDSVVRAAGNLSGDFSANVKEYTEDALEHLILASLIYIALCIFLYFGIVKWKIIGFHQDVKTADSRVLIVIAHPDDECMFFGPTVLNFTRQKDRDVYLLCLSTGHNYGMSKVRKNELYKSCSVLGIKQQNVIIKQSTNLPDTVDSKWPIEAVSQLVLDEVERYEIQALITFDKHGISNHPNHCSIYYAIAHLSVEHLIPKYCTVYVLETVNIIRKYWSFLDIPLSFLLSRQRYILDCSNRFTVYKAMWQHKSQLLWFRYLYLLFSKYVFINTLQKMNLSDIELDLAIDD